VFVRDEFFGLGFICERGYAKVEALKVLNLGRHLPFSQISSFLEKLARNKHSSLFVSSVSDIEK
jgi:hypothetical protein